MSELCMHCGKRHRIEGDPWCQYCLDRYAFLKEAREKAEARVAAAGLGQP